MWLLFAREKEGEESGAAAQNLNFSGESPVKRLKNF